MKRRGFTLIELMVVIAIIIILAAIAIPNYLTMTARAKRSRVASDMATVATVLETFKTDWGKYPVTATPTAWEDLSTTAPSLLTVSGALGGFGGVGGLVNIPANTNAVGEKGGIEYIKAGTLTSMTNPFDSTFKGMQYASTDGTHWRLMMDSKGTATTPTEWMVRDDNISTAVTVSASPSIP